MKRVQNNTTCFTVTSFKKCTLLGEEDTIILTRHNKPNTKVKMQFKFSAAVLIFCALLQLQTTNGQLLAALGDLFSPISSFFGGAPVPRPGFPGLPALPGFTRGAGPGGPGGPFRDDGTQVPY